jgi:hypothetical protein
MKVKCTKDNLTTYTSIGNVYVLVELLKLGYKLELI